ncbi:MAG: YkgJ family cysteine cluster protein [Planctomycetota bacterium]
MVQKTPPSGDSPWYRDGLRFECTQCGGCCSGEPGFVWVEDSEIAGIAQHMQLSIEEFEDKFVRRVRGRKSLKEYPDGDCLLLDPESRGCLVYSARPIQCRTWPFWKSNTHSPQAWAETCEECPGAGTGRLYSLGEIETQRNEKTV